VKILTGDVLEKIKEIPDESVDCIVTSPPYFNLRDYGTAFWEGGDINCKHDILENEKDPKNPNAGSHIARFNKEKCYKCGAIRKDKQIGLENTLDDYINKMLSVTKQCKRILKKTGSLWWNHGDSYAGNNSRASNNGRAGYGNEREGIYKIDDVPSKSLLMTPYRLAIKMIDEQGWIMRNLLIWKKNNCMPSSVKDRFTVDFEPVFFFVKNQKYYFKQLKDPYTEPMNRWGGDYKKRAINEKIDPAKKANANSLARSGRDMRPDKEGKNKRVVWEVNTKPFTEAHFAVFPEALIEPMVEAGCPEFICKKCGKAREVIYEKNEGKVSDNYLNTKVSKTQTGGKFTSTLSGTPHSYKEIGLTDCGCNAGFNGGVVFDPFTGAGTTAVVAIKKHREFIGVELNPEYVKIAEKRIENVQKQVEFDDITLF